MLGTEPEIVATFVETGKVTLVFWPVINHGQPSVNASLANHCVGLQDAAAFWPMHEYLFANLNSLYRADYGYYRDAALQFVSDEAAFEACYGDQATIDVILNLDQIRRDRGIFGQPFFDINGQIYAGAAPFDVFSAVIESYLP